MLSVESISIKRESKLLLNKVSVTLNPGEVLAIVGSNGAGKTSLLKSLSGDTPIESGKATLNGRCLKKWSLPEMAKIRAVLPQHSVLSFPFSVIEVVSMGRSPHRNQSSSIENRKIVSQSMRLARIDNLKHRNINSLSGGERQRVHLARVLAQIWKPIKDQSRYLLLDEPTSALDMQHQHELLGIARNLAVEQNIAVLAIVHDLNLASLYADRTAMMSNGKIEHIGSTSSVLTSNNIEAVFNIEARILNDSRLTYPVIAAQPHPIGSNSFV